MISSRGALLSEYNNEDNSYPGPVKSREQQVNKETKVSQGSIENAWMVTTERVHYNV